MYVRKAAAGPLDTQASCEVRSVKWWLDSAMLLRDIA